jgi:hypothetical protein
VSTERGKKLGREILSLVKDIDDMFMGPGAKEWAKHFHSNPDVEDDLARLHFLHSQVCTSAGAMHQGLIKSVLLLHAVYETQEDSGLKTALEDDFFLYDRIYQTIRPAFLHEFGLVFGDPT